MVPYLDMPYNEASTAQLTWKLSDKEDTAAGSLSVVHHGRTRKYCQLYRSYGDLDNERLVLHSGFSRMADPADRMRITWALVDGVGGVPCAVV